MTRDFLPKYRTYSAYLCYSAGVQKRSFTEGIIDIILVIVVFFALFGSSTINSVMEALVVALCVVRFLYSVYKIYNKARQFFRVKNRFSIRRQLHIERYGDVYTLSQILPGTKEGKEGAHTILLDRDEKSAVIWSETLNTQLWDSEIPLEKKSRCSGARHRVQNHPGRYLNVLKAYVHEAMTRETWLFNESKWCLASDVEIGARAVQYMKGSYFDSLLSNDLCLSIYTEKVLNVEEVFFDGQDNYPVDILDRKAHLKGISFSRMNNHVGVSCLALTRDGYFVVWRQSKSAFVDSSLAVPSGNGSADWADIPKNIVPTLADAVANGMERELREESIPVSLRASARMDTRVLAYYRWLAKGGKPQFVGITKLLDCDLVDMVPHEGYIPTEGIQGYHVANMDDLENALVSIDGIANKSLALSACVRALRECAKERPDDLEQFLFGHGTAAARRT